jgi:hypothetical protein
MERAVLARPFQKDGGGGVGERLRQPVHPPHLGQGDRKRDGRATRVPGTIRGAKPALSIGSPAEGGLRRAGPIRSGRGHRRGEDRGDNRGRAYKACDPVGSPLHRVQSRVPEAQKKAESKCAGIGAGEFEPSGELSRREARLRHEPFEQGRRKNHASRCDRRIGVSRPRSLRDQAAGDRNCRWRYGGCRGGRACGCRGRSGRRGRGFRSRRCRGPDEPSGAPRPSRSALSQTFVGPRASFGPCPVGRSPRGAGPIPVAAGGTSPA